MEHYDHNIIRSNQDQFLDGDQFANPQLTEKSPKITTTSKRTLLNN